MRIFVQNILIFVTETLKMTQRVWGTERNVY